MTKALTATWVIQNKVKKWTDKQKQQAKEMIKRKKNLYGRIQPTKEARKQYRDAKMIVKNKTYYTR